MGIQCGSLASAWSSKTEETAKMERMSAAARHRGSVPPHPLHAF
ncbi:hypothetical protein ARSEF1564_009359 [Beauveria bassiana]